MIFEETKLSGAFIIKPERLKDSRGFFSRTFCQYEFFEHQLSTGIAQCSMSFNENKGTFRGMHYQIYPYEEEKVVMCYKGAILDIIVDLRTDSPTYKQWTAVELNEDNLNMLYIPKSFAHGFLTLQESTLISYMMTQFHHSDSARGFRWNDPAFDIKLPRNIAVISERDKNYPDFDETKLSRTKYADNHCAII